MSSQLDAVFLEAKNFYLDGELIKCIHSLDDVITSTESSYNKGVALCLRAFCRQECKSRLSDEELSKWEKQDRGPEHTLVVKDMRDALDTWATLPLVTILPERKSMMVVLLNNIIDLASIMGFPKVIASAQKCMFALLEPTERKKNLARLWEWRRISHAMCASPVNKIFIDVLSKYCGEASRGVDFWIDSLEEPALIVGWKHNFSYTFSALCCNKPNLNSTDLKSFHGGVTIGEAATTASACSMDEDYSTDEVSSNDDSSIEGSSIDYRSKYMGAYLYYDLCERLAANGRLIDALHCASLAAGIRLELYTKIFDEQSQGVLTQLWPLETVLSDLQSFYLSPWNVLKCFLESLLQVGTMYEMNGNEEDAISALEDGEALSNTYSLPIFKILFSSALGKLSQKGNSDEMGKEKSERASECFEDFKYFFSCETCKWTIKATLMLDRMGDHGNTDEKVSLSKLLDSVPEISVSYSVDKVSEYEMCICNKKGCWQCIPLDVMNSGLVQNFVDLRCKFVCRRLCLGLLARSGDHCEIHEMSNNIFQRTSILLNRVQVLDISVNDWESYLPLLVNDVPGDSLSIERAELLHYIYCWKILAHEPSHDFVQEDELLLLLQAFVLCREVPVLFQKVSRLLAVIFSYIASKKPSQLLFEVHVKELASYFQQVSVGSRIFGINNIGTKRQNSRIAPASVAQLKKFVEDFFTSLPRATTIICISLLDSSIAGLLQPFFGSCPAAWIIASCLRYKKAPTVLFMPVSKTLEGSTKLNEAAPRSNWRWDPTVIDKLAPEFKSIMSEMSMCLYGDTNVPLKRLDDRICEFLKNLEEAWFAPLRKVITKSDFTKPFYFVLDLELQMLPLESMPLFRNAEIYRIPAIGLMCSTVDINKYPQKKDSVRGVLPSINILKGFYLSNPEGLKEFEVYQEAFENQFQCENIKGYAGSCPDVEILSKNLKSEDLFIYLGHGDGTRFIEERQILHLKRCAAACLLGCCSAAVKWRGHFFPQWTPNAYLCAGAPFAVCSLWFLYDPDIGMFLQELLSQKDPVRIGAFIRDFRLSYKYLPYVFGAALVVYGAPTVIHSKKKKKINRKQA